MIGVLIKYNEKILFTALPKENEKLEKQLANIGLNIKPQDMQISNKTELGYSIEIYAQDSTEMEIAAKICNTDTLGRLNELMQFIDKEYITDLYDIVAYGDFESVEELYRKLTSPPKPEATEKLKIKTCLSHKVTYYEPSECVVEKVIALSAEEFQHLLNEPLDDYDFIKDNRMMMYCDENEVEHCLLVYDRDSGDGLLINAEGYDYARYSAFIPHAKDIAEQFEMEKNGIQTVKAPVTDSEKRLLDLISSTADRIATFAHLGYKDFTLEDVLKDLNCEFSDIKGMILHAAAEKVKANPDIASVEVNELDIPLQPEITVITKEEMEETAAEEEELGGLSF